MGQEGGQGTGAPVDRAVAAQHQVGRAEGREGGGQRPGQAALVLGQLAHVAVAVALVAGRDPDDGGTEGGHLAQHGSTDAGPAQTATTRPPGLGDAEGVLEGGGVGRGEPDARAGPG